MTILFCGIPGAGKTTIATKLAAKLEDLWKVRLFSSDALRAPVYKKLLNLLEESEEKFDFLIFDATFYREEHRANMKSHARGIVIIAFCDVSLETALARNKERAAKIPVIGLQTIAGHFERPIDPDVYLNTEELSADEAARRLFRYITELPPDDLTEDV